MTLTKAQLTDSIRKQVDLPKPKSSQVIDSLLEIIKATLENDEDVLISGFGKFCVKEKRKRRGRNPATEEDLMLDARRVVTFRCSGLLKDKLNTGKKLKARKRSAR
jgi:integration host factor subunit alpha